MKKIAWLINLFCIGIIYSNAQPIFNSSNWPAMGSSFTEFTVDNPVFAPGNAGPNQLWDFSDLVPKPVTSTLRYYPGIRSRVIVRRDSYNEFYYEVSSTNCYYISSEIGGAITYYTPHIEYFRFPLTYNSAYTTSYGASFNDQHPPNGGEVGNLRGTCSVVADAMVH